MAVAGSSKDLRKPGFPEPAAPGSRSVGETVAFAPEHQAGGGEIGQDLPPQGQGGGVALMGQVAGEQDQARGRLQGADFRHGPSQSLSFGTAIFAVL